MGEFGREQLKILYVDGVPEFHASDDSQIRNEELIWSLYDPMLSLSLLTNPIEWAVPREPEVDNGYVEEMRKILPEKDMWAVEALRLSEQVGLEQNPTRQATSFPVKLMTIDDMPVDGHPGLEFLKTELAGREIVTIAEIEAIAAKWKAR